MIVTFMGTPSAGKSFLARKIAEHYSLKHYSIGDLRRQAAQEQGMTLAEYNKLGESKDTDTKFDEYQKSLPSKNPDFVIDGRLSAFFLPQAIKIFVDASEDVRAQRMLKEDSDHKRVGESPQSFEEAKKLMQERVISDISRYKKHYSFNPYEKKGYDIIFDTTNLSKEECVKELIELIDKRNI